MNLRADGESGEWTHTDTVERRNDAGEHDEEGTEDREEAWAFGGRLGPAQRALSPFDWAQRPRH